MVADATRGVKFVLKTELDPGAAKAFEAVEKRVADLQKSMNLTMQMEGRANGRNGTGSPQGEGAAARLADVESTKREAAERTSRRRLSNMRREADERDRVQAEKSARDSERFNQQMLEQQISDLRKAETAKAKEFAAASKRRVAEAKREQRSDREFWGDFSSYGEGRAKARAAAEKRLHREAEAAEMKMAFAQQHLRQGFMQATTAVTGLARGMVELGLVGEKNIDKVKDGLLKVYAATDLIRGGVEMWDIMARGARVYREALLATAAAERAVAAAGAARGAASSVARGVAGHAIGRSAAEMSGAYLLGRGAGQLRAAGARTAAAVGPYAAVAGVAALAYGAHGAYGRHIEAGEEYQRGQRGYAGQSRLGHWFEVQGRGGMVERLARFGVGNERQQERLDAETEGRLAKREARLRAAHERSSIFSAENASRDEALQGRLRANSMRFSGGRFTTDAQSFALQRQALAADRRALEARQQQATAQVAETIGPNGEIGAGREEAIRAALEVEKQIAELKARELQLTREERDAAIEGARKKLELIQQQLAAGRQGARGAKETADDFAIRFGRLLPGQQRSLATIKQQLQSGATISRHQEEFAREHGDAEIQDLVRKTALERGRKAEAQFGLGGRENRELGYAREKVEALKGMAGDTQDKIERDLNVRLKNELNVGRVEVETVLSTEAENKLLDAVEDSAVKFETKLPEIVEAILGRAKAQTDAQIKDAIRRVNAQGRGLSGA